MKVAWAKRIVQPGETILPGPRSRRRFRESPRACHAFVTHDHDERAEQSRCRPFAGRSPIVSKGEKYEVPDVGMDRSRGRRCATRGNHLHRLLGLLWRIPPRRRGVPGTRWPDSGLDQRGGGAAGVAHDPDVVARGCQRGGPLKEDGELPAQALRVRRARLYYLRKRQGKAARLDTTTQD